MATKSCMMYLMLTLLAMSAHAGEPAPASDTVRAVVDRDGKQRVNLVGGDYYFRPSHIIVRANLPVELTVRREEGIKPHTFVLRVPEAGIMIDKSLDTDVQVIAFTPTVVGKFTYYCRNKLLFFKSHREKGMEGVLEVVP